MARKASDLFSLLQSRGRGRGGSSRRSAGGAIGKVFGSVTGAVRGLMGSRGTDVGRGSRSSRSAGNTIRMSGLGMAGIAFLCLGVGYLLGDAFPLSGQAALRAGTSTDAGKGSGTEGAGPRQPVRPGPIGNQGPNGGAAADDGSFAPLTNEGFFLAAFGNGQKQRAVDLAAHLRGQGIDSVRAYWYQAGSDSQWVTVAYFDGPANAAKTRADLLKVPGPAADPEFENVRKRTKDWPPVVVFK